MINRMHLISSLVILLIGLVITVEAKMTSTNYTISTTVMSGGGGPMESANYRIIGTLGQSSPLIDPAFPPQSPNYDLLTGFWYTIGSTPPFSACPADFEPDGDVDDDDLTILAEGFGESGLVVDTDEDGDMDGKDLWEMVMDFGRTDCMD